jgi:hypothetical protein
MNRREASDGFAADIRCELLLMITLGARRIALSAECFELCEGCSVPLCVVCLSIQRNDLNW